MSLATSLYTYVQAQSSITALIGTRFRPQILRTGDSGTPEDPQGATVYRRSSRLRTPTSGGETGFVTTSVVMTHFHWEYDDCEAIAEAFRLKLDGLARTDVGTEFFSSCFLMLETDDLESLQFAKNDAPYFITQEYQIIHRETPSGL